jgi:hypothetical protein
MPHEITSSITFLDYDSLSNAEKKLKEISESRGSDQDHIRFKGKDENDLKYFYLHKDSVFSRFRCLVNTLFKNISTSANERLQIRKDKEETACRLIKGLIKSAYPDHFEDIFSPYNEVKVLTRGDLKEMLKQAKNLPDTKDDMNYINNFLNELDNNEVDIFSYESDSDSNLVVKETYVD